MIQFFLEKLPKSHLHILCLGSHCDDIEIGCGGTLLKLTERCSDICVDWIVFSGNERRKKEALASSEWFLKHVKNRNVIIRDFRDGFFPFVGANIKEYFETMKHAVNPDLIFTHYGKDFHQDHRVISELTWNTFRDHLILEYEIPKYDGDIGSPNFFVHLDAGLCETKIRYIENSFTSQSQNHWFSRDAFYSLLKFRGIESNSPTGYAEGFYSRKVIFNCGIV